MRVKLIILVCLFFCVGCIPKSGTAEFITVVSDHNELCKETNEVLIKSIEDDIKRRVDTGKSDPDTLLALNELIYRLELIKRQSLVIDTWVKSNEVTPEIISEMIKSRWRGEK